MTENKRRITLNKPIGEMGMTELALNNCFIRNKNAMFRDYEAEYDAREFIKMVAKTLGIEIFVDDPEDIDFVLFDWLEDGYDSPQGIIALLYLMIWSKAELYEHLKDFENAKEAIEEAYKAEKETT